MTGVLLDKWAILDHPTLAWEPHAGQLAVAESNARHRVVSAGRRFGKSDLGGHELIPEVFFTRPIADDLKQAGKRREFWIVGPEYCVDEKTEILTDKGWKSQSELLGDETVLTQNPKTGLAEWQEMKYVSIFHSNHRYIYESEFRGHSSATTGEHRWLVSWGKPNRYGRQIKNLGEPRFGWRFKTTEELGVSSEKISCAAPVANLPEEPKLKDALVELVAWYWTEGSTQWSKVDGRACGGSEISQNEGAHFDRIKRACQSMFGDPSESMKAGSKDSKKPSWRIVSKGGTIRRAVVFNVHAASIIREWCEGREKAVSYEFLNLLTSAQLELFISCSIWADGISRWDTVGHAEIGQRYEYNIDMLQMACSMSGRKSVKVTGRNGYGPWFGLSIYSVDRTTIGGANLAASSVRKSHSGVVWCPTTPNGTWLARRNGTVYFTGNSDAEKEFRVLWNNLSRLQVPFDRPGSYNDPIGGSLHLSVWGGAFQVHGKSAKYPDTLVGEGLSGCILAEAAKLKPIVWTKYIRPTLADFDGWSLHTSTPEGKNHFYDKWRMGQDPKNPKWASWRMPAWRNHYVYKTDTVDADVKRMQELQREDPDASCYEIAEKLGLQIDGEILDLAEDMTIESFNQEIGADFTEFVGRVFKDFDEEYHVGDLEWNSSPEWQTFAGVDYGYTNPNVWLLIQVGPWGEINVLKEIYEPNLTDWEFADEIKRRGLCPPNMIYFYADPADPGASRVLESRLKVRSKGGTGGELNHRLGAIRKALKARRVDPKTHNDAAFWEDPRGQIRPQLMFDRSCVHTINDMAAYRYPEKKDESSTKQQELPMKKDDHGPEALGRFFAGFFGTPQQEASRSRVTRGRFARRLG